MTYELSCLGDTPVAIDGYLRLYFSRWRFDAPISTSGDVWVQLFAATIGRRFEDALRSAPPALLEQA